MIPLAPTPFSDLLEAVAAKTPAPGGGAVAGAVGALGAALAAMTVSYSVGKKSLAAHEPALRDAEARLARARATLLQLADEDGLAYQALNEVQRLPESDPRRARELPDAARACVQVPLVLAGACAELLRLFKALAPIINTHLRSDLAIAAILAEATARASWHNVAVNAGLLPDADRDRALDQARALVDDCRAMSSAVEALCRGG